MKEKTRTVGTRFGEVTGAVERGVLYFRGIPYAMPPVGGLRFQDAREPQLWQARLDATACGPAAPQLPSRLETVMGKREVSWSEDCLNLNITVKEGGGPKPVLVWIHGGAFVTGGNSLDWYDGRAFAESGLVFVGLNYWLGALGFLKKEGVASGRMGLTDVIQGLRFIREQIQAFGGDPQRITVMGQSAGAQTILCMLAEEETDGLFQRAILQSPPLESTPYSEEEAAESGTEILQLLGEGSPLDGETLKALPTERLLSIPGSYAMRYLNKRGLMLFKPTLESCAGTELLIRAAAEGAARKGVAVILGGVSHERNSFALPDGTPHPYEEDTEFWLPTVALARALEVWGVETWLYRFEWYPQGSPFYACHCIELPFVFRNLWSWRDAPMLWGRDRDGRPTPWGGEREEAVEDTVPAKLDQLSETMHRAWCRFAAGAAPMETGWPLFRSENAEGTTLRVR